MPPWLIQLIPGPVDRALRSDFAQKVAETFGTRLLLIALNAVNTILIARILGPEGRGQYAVAIVVAAIGSQVLSLGVQAANTYFVAQDRTLLARLTSNSLALSVATLAAGGLAYGAFALVPSAAPVPLGLMALAILSVPPTLLVLNLRHLLLGIGDVRTYNLVDLIAGVVGTAVTLALALSGAATPASLLAVTLLVALLGVGIAARGLRPELASVPRPSTEWLRKCFAYGLRVWLATGFGLLLLKSDLLVIQFDRGSESSGLYSIASSIADMLWILPSVVGAILFPRLTAIRDPGERWRLTLKTTAGMLVAFVPILCAAALLASPAIRIMFGSEFEDAAPSLQILCAAILFYGTSSVFSQFLAARGFPWTVVGIWAAAFALNLVLNLVLVPELGIEGAALSSLIAYAGAFAGLVLLSIRYARLDRASGVPDPGDVPPGPPSDGVER